MIEGMWYEFNRPISITCLGETYEVKRGKCIDISPIYDIGRFVTDEVAPIRIEFHVLKYDIKNTIVGYEELRRIYKGEEL